MSSDTGTRVAIIDDQPSVRTALARGLRRMNCQIFEAADGEEGLRTIEQEKVEVVFLDLRMPGMDGHTVLRRLAENGIDVSVVVMSGDGDMEDVIEVMRFGAVDFLRKPWTPTALMTAFARAVDRYEVQGTDGKYQHNGKIQNGEHAAEQVFQNLLAGRFSLPPAPKMLLSLRELRNRGNANLDELGRLVDADKGFSAHLVRLSNSIGGSREATHNSVRTALSLLGLRQVHALGETILLRDVFVAQGDFAKERLAAIWRHAVARAVSMRGVADLLAERDRIHPESAYVTGLLADCGASLLVSLCSQSDATFGEKDDSWLRERIAEHHVTLSRALLSRWAFDPVTIGAVAVHHMEEPPPAATDYWRIFWVAESLATELTGAADPTTFRQRNPILAERCAGELQIGSSILQKIKPGLAQEFNDILGLFA